MELVFLGMGAAFNPAWNNTNAFFVYDNEFFLLDCGETAFGEIWNNSSFVAAKQITVIITHLHCDHVGSLASLISYCHYVLHKPVFVVHPLTTIVNLLDTMGITQDIYTYQPFYTNNKNVNIEAVEVEHVSNMTCYGYVVQAGSLNFYFSGDSISIPNSVMERFRSQDIEYIYQDTCLEGGAHPTHCTLDALENAFFPEERSRVFCIHLDSDFRPLIQKKGFRLVPLLSEIDN